MEYKIIMGVTPINKFSTKNEDQQLYSKYAVVRHDTMNSIVYLEAKNSSKEYVMKQVTSNDERSRFKVQELIRHKINKRESALVKLEDVLYVNMQDYCHERLKVCLIFENPTRDLKLDILQRRIKSQPYKEQQLLQIIVSIIQGLKFLKQIDQPHQAICSKNVFLYTNKQVKLLDPWLKTSNLQQLPSYHIYPSPQKLEEGQNITQKNKFDWYLSDLYSLGILGLEAYHLQFMNDLYQNKKIDQQLLQQRIQSIKYLKLKQVIKGLTGPPRLRYQTVSDICSEYTKKIHISPSPPKNQNVPNLLKLSPKNNQQRGKKSPTRFIIPSNPHLIETKQRHTQYSPSKKIGPKFNIPSSHRNTLIKSPNVGNNLEVKVMNMEVGVFETPNMIKQNSRLTADTDEKTGKRVILQQRNFKPLVKGTSVGIIHPFQKYAETKELKNMTKPIKQNFDILCERQYKTQDIKTAKKWNLSKIQPYRIKQEQKIYVTPTTFNSASRQDSSVTFNTSPSLRFGNLLRPHSDIIHPQVENPLIDLSNQHLDLEFQALKNYATQCLKSSKENKIVYINGSYYEGDIVNGLKEGNGKLYSPNDAIVYVGQWKDDVYDGYGTLKNGYVSKLADDFSYQNMNNLRFGWIQYEGNFVLGKKSGFGKIFIVNGDIFQGQFLNQRIHGYGIYIKNNGKRIQGEWISGYYSNM